MKTMRPIGWIMGVLLCLNFAGCPQPGEGGDAERGYDACRPIIEALARHHTDLSHYPEELAVLIPAYLSEIPASVNDYPIEYKRTETSYQLEFSYVGPGMNHCRYAPETDWVCRGYF